MFAVRIPADEKKPMKIEAFSDSEDFDDQCGEALEGNQDLITAASRDISASSLLRNGERMLCRDYMVLSDELSGMEDERVNRRASIIAFGFGSPGELFGDAMLAKAKDGTIGIVEGLDFVDAINGLRRLSAALGEAPGMRRVNIS